MNQYYLRLALEKYNQAHGAMVHAVKYMHYAGASREDASKADGALSLNTYMILNRINDLIDLALSCIKVDNSLSVDLMEEELE